MHMPVIPRPEFKGRTGQGDWADSLLELDTDFGTVLDLLDALGISGNTIVVCAGDNGPEEALLWRGTPVTSKARISPAAKATSERLASSVGLGMCSQES
jgi:arylsulfatase A-like enzyme